MPKFGTRYTPEEDAYIIANYHSSTIEEIAKHLGRSAHSISKHAGKIGVPPKIKRGANYTADEDVYIAENYYSKPARDIAAHLGRTAKSIRKRFEKLGLVPKKIVRRWAKADNDFLRNRGDKKLKEVAEILGRDMSEVSEHATRLGVPFRREYRIDSRGYARVQIRLGNGERRTVQQHRKVMEDILGRPLRKGEVVHHINGIKSDNSPENLYLYESLKEHRIAHASLEKLLPALINLGVVTFDRETGTYKLVD